MKLLKTYIAIAIANWILISAITLSVPALRSSQHGRVSDENMPVATIAPSSTPSPKKTIVRVKRVIVLEPTGTIATQPLKQTTTQSSPSTNANPTAAPDVQVPVPTQDTRCIITIDGARYDVTQFRSMHSGGNIFTCNADMSATFWSQHGQGTLNKMASYRI